MFFNLVVLLDCAWHAAFVHQMAAEPYTKVYGGKPPTAAALMSVALWHKHLYSHQLICLAAEFHVFILKHMLVTSLVEVQLQMQHTQAFQHAGHRLLSDSDCALIIAASTDFFYYFPLTVTECVCQAILPISLLLAGLVYVAKQLSERVTTSSGSPSHPNGTAVG